MIELTIEMDVIPDKRQEMVQTIRELLERFSDSSGCLNCKFYQSVDDDTTLSLISSWNTKEALKHYLQSDSFSVLLGAMKHLLKKPPETRIETVAHTAGLEEIR